MPGVFWAGFILIDGREKKGSRKQLSEKSGHLAFISEKVPIRVSGHPVPVFLSEGLLPHSHVLLLVHQSQQRRAGLDPQAIVVVLGVPPEGAE